MIKKASKLKVNKQCFVEKDLCGRFSDLKSHRELMINQKMLYQMGDNNEVIIAKGKWKLVQFEIERLSQFNQTNPINFYIVQFEKKVFNCKVLKKFVLENTSASQSSF